MKKIALPLFLAALPFVANADGTSPEVSLSRALKNYKLNIEKERPFSSYPEYHRVGVAWNQGGSCGDFDMDFSIASTLSKQDLQRMLDNWVTQAKNAFDPASLIALALQRANPDLYEILMNGVIEARGIYENDTRVCEAIQNTLLDSAPDGWVDKLAVGKEFEKRVAQVYEDNHSLDIGDMNDFVWDSGKKGFELLGQMVGGKDQPKAKVVESAATAGFNTAVERKVAAGTDIDVANKNPITVTDEVKRKHPFTRYFDSPESVTEYVNKIVGETEISTDNGENPFNHLKGVGLHAVMIEKQNEYEEDIRELLDLMEGTTSENFTIRDIEAFNSTITSSFMTVGMLKELKSMSPAPQQMFVEQLANQYAFSHTIDKVFTARRIIKLGSKETSIFKAEFVRSTAEDKIAELDKEIELLETEYRIKQQYATNVGEELYKRALESERQGLVVSPVKGVIK